MTPARLLSCALLTLALLWEVRRAAAQTVPPAPADIGTLCSPGAIGVPPTPVRKNLRMWCPPTRCRRGVLRSHVLRAPPLLLFVPPTRLDASGATGRCSTNQGKCTTNKDCKNKPTDPGSCIYTSDQAHGLVAGKLACIRACAPAMLCQRFRVRPGQLGPPLLLNCDGYTACSNLFGRTGNRRSGFIF